MKVLIANINKAVKYNSTTFVIKSLDNNKLLLELLQKRGFIQGTQWRGNYCIVYLKQQQLKSLDIHTKSIESITKIKLIKQNVSISANQFDNLNKLTGNAFCHVISTDHGVTDSYAKNYKLGGLPLLSIY